LIKGKKKASRNKLNSSLFQLKKKVRLSLKKRKKRKTRLKVCGKKALRVISKERAIATCRSLSPRRK